ncbi:kinase-like domain-containing protein [Ilyonectria sp. MPI-CAGE-AT-0026]|nr:kinase-like domain-containing protein [Ilyonectria sp. MPI-CAGE-AT-0026]
MSAAPSPNPAPSNGLHPPLRSALKSDDDGDRPPPSSGSLKAVQIADTEPEVQLLEDESQPMRQFPAGPKRRLSGKLPPCQLPNGSSRSSLSESSASIRPTEDTSTSSPQQSHRRQYYSEKLLAQVNDWLEHEKRKATARKPKPRRRKSKSPPKGDGQDSERPTREDKDQSQNGRARSESVDSQSSDISFDRLQRILEDSMAHMGFSSVPHFSPKLTRPRHRKSSSRNSLRAASSDTDYVDGDAIVPSCDAWLDNSKTMSYGGGAAGTEDATSGSDSKVEKEREAWLSFKNEIIRITHTLRLKGWRRIPLGGGDSISVERLSGALTNAVYVVNPPADMGEVDGKAPPPKILLRVYGPQVEHLIDRENELQVLQRLARKRIGPRLLGTFQNGRFEQFFNAITLTPLDLRDQYISRQIAKRMRELHVGIDLLPHERQNGPNVWRNWDQWLENVDRITTFLDNQFEKETQTTQHDSVLHAWKNSGYVCGAPWPQFKEAVFKYRAYLEGRYNGRKDINNRLVFAHSDTQYGNILRVRPDDEKSPLLQPANQHKQLIVIDFEYAGANLPGIEFANHFTEWTYNYHDAVTSYACNERRYPTVEEQKRFIKAYVDHRPRFPSTTTSTPLMAPSDGSLSSGPSTPLVQAHPGPSSNSIVDFMLDARVPPGGWTAAERANEEQSDQRVRELLEETKLWRPANHVQWIAWGIVQAKVPGLDESVTEEDVGPDEFDYLRYTQDRAMFFWGDCVQIGLVKAEELPTALQSRLKIVDY